MQMYNNDKSDYKGRVFTLSLFSKKKGIDMKIINKNVYKIMFGSDFINANEVKEIEDKKIIELLLNQPNVEEFVDVKELKDIEEENKKLKAELAKAKAGRPKKAKAK